MRDIEIPADSVLHLGDDGPTVTLTDLEEPLTPAQGVEVTLTFEKAGEVTVLALVSTPDRDLPRGEAFDFHQEEHPNEGQEENTEVSGGGNPESGG